MINSKEIMSSFVEQIKNEIGERVKTYVITECNALSYETGDNSEKESFMNIEDDIDVSVDNSDGEISLNINIGENGDYTDSELEMIDMINNNVQAILDARMETVTNDIIENHIEELQNTIVEEITTTIGGMFA